MLSTTLRTLRTGLPARRPLPSLTARRAVVAHPFSTTRTRSAEADKVKAPDAVDAFMNGGNAYYADEMYKLWREVSRSLDGGRSSEGLHQMGGGCGCWTLVATVPWAGAGM
jgi:hypothetical protein